MCERCGGGLSACFGNCSGPDIWLVGYTSPIGHERINELYKTLHKVWLNQKKFEMKVTQEDFLRWKELGRKYISALRNE